jgi:tripartite motif-containing protein 2/3
MQRELSNLTECFICADTYSDPRTLPCVHTFCLRCIEGFREHKLPGDRVSCPLCRKEFAIPENGAEDLPKNFFIEQLKHLVITSDGRCEEDEGADETDSTSSKHQLRYCGQHKDRSIELYCHDCNSAICTRCLVESYKQHQYPDVSQVLGDFRNQLTDDIKEMNEAVSRYRDMLSNQKHSKKDFYSVIDEIRSRYANEPNS